jgi:hypothetical protein
MYLAIEKINLFRIGFIKEYGERKYRKIFLKVHTSNKIRNLINQSLYKRMAPNKNDFLYSLNEIPFFIFSRADTLAMGALLSLELWHTTLNQNYSFLNEFELNNLFEAIIEDCDKMIIKL